MKKYIFALIIIISFVNPVNASEYIQNFHSDIQVLDDGDIIVTETITVNVENRYIRHGIFRNTPTVYYGIFFTHKNSGINIIRTKLDGKPVPYHTERLLNGIRIYLGSKDSYVSQGIHSYEIKYKAEQQVADLDRNNGIYWNVTGNNWDFPIHSASADIYLPTNENITIDKYDGWTGKMGSTAQNYNAAVYSDHIHFQTSQRLSAYEGFTIQAQWPKGLMSQTNNKVWAFLKSNFFWLLSVAMLFMYPLYFFRTWKKVGIDPPKGAIYPIFTPPDDISPAALRYVRNTYHDSKGFSVAIMNLAVKKYISIERLAHKKYRLSKTQEQNRPKLTRGEKSIYSYLFKYKDTLEIGKKYNSRVKTADNLLANTLKSEYKDACYRDNLKAWILGTAISLLVIALNWSHFFNFSGYAIPFLIFPTIVIMASAFAIALVKKTWQKLLTIILPASVILIVANIQTEKIYLAYITIILFVLVLNALFYYLIQAPTVFGRKLLDRIEGFKMYLQTAEQDRLEVMHPPEMTPQLFEKYLPYALALGVENKWSEQFNNAMKIQHQDVSDYHPAWYIGNDFSSHDFAGTASSIGAGLASAAVAASTPPASSGSSGGFSGGGFSGGGGGGGGGGGW